MAKAEHSCAGKGSECPTLKRKGPRASWRFHEFWRNIPQCSSEVISQRIKLWLFWSCVIFLPVSRISSSLCVRSGERRGSEMGVEGFPPGAETTGNYLRTSSGVGSALYARLSRFSRNVFFPLTSTTLIWLRQPGDPVCSLLPRKVVNSSQLSLYIIIYIMNIFHIIKVIQNPDSQLLHNSPCMDILQVTM